MKQNLKKFLILLCTNSFVSLEATAYQKADFCVDHIDREMNRLLRGSLDSPVDAKITENADLDLEVIGEDGFRFVAQKKKKRGYQDDKSGDQYNQSVYRVLGPRIGSDQRYVQQARVLRLNENCEVIVVSAGIEKVVKAKEEAKKIDYDNLLSINRKFCTDFSRTFLKERPDFDLKSGQKELKKLLDEKESTFKVISRETVNEAVKLCKEYDLVRLEVSTGEEAEGILNQKKKNRERAFKKEEDDLIKRRKRFDESVERGE